MSMCGRDFLGCNPPLAPTKWDLVEEVTKSMGKKVRIWKNVNMHPKEGEEKRMYGMREKNPELDGGMHLGVDGTVSYAIK